MSILLASLQSIPNVVWSGLLGSLFTLGGVLISNWSNTTRLKIQLGHDAEQKAKERIIGLRRDVYLNVVEELTKANTHLTKLPQLDFAEINPSEGFQGFLASAAKLQLVAEPKTALLVNDLIADYGEIIFTSIAAAAPLQKYKSSTSIADELYKRADAEVKRLLSEMARMNESGKVDAITFQVLKSSIDFQQEIARKYSSERSLNQSEFLRESKIFYKTILLKMQKVGAQQIPAFIAIREDLGLTTEIDKIRSQMEKNWERMTKTLDEAMDAI